MAHWLFKSEPSVFSFEALVACGACQQPLQPAASLAQVSTDPPERPERHGQAQSRLELPAVPRPAQRRAQVVVLVLQARQLGYLPRADQARCGVLHEGEEIRRVPALQRRHLSGSRQARQPVLPDRLQHPKARLSRPWLDLVQ